jgi:hypothetical protein
VNTTSTLISEEEHSLCAVPTMSVKSHNHHFGFSLHSIWIHVTKIMQRSCSPFYIWIKYRTITWTHNGKFSLHVLIYLLRSYSMDLVYYYISQWHYAAKMLSVSVIVLGNGNLKQKWISIIMLGTERVQQRFPFSAKNNWENQVQTELSSPNAE